MITFCKKVDRTTTLQHDKCQPRRPNASAETTNSKVQAPKKFPRSKFQRCDPLGRLRLFIGASLELGDWVLVAPPSAGNSPSPPTVDRGRGVNSAHYRQ